VNGKCELEGCSADADGSWFAQWTIADFMDVEACKKHAGTLGLWLQRRTVDGVDCLELTWTGYEIPSLPT
jgi:hypothetical protein